MIKVWYLILVFQFPGGVEGLSAVSIPVGKTEWDCIVVAREFERSSRINSKYCIEGYMK